ncbi:MAG: hypothetical protein OEY33_03490 [Bdellovibrionales bacterium]|nr:hypothetical protein [Bdellovibrionales bacterium]
MKKTTITLLLTVLVNVTHAAVGVFPLSQVEESLMSAKEITPEGREFILDGLKAKENESFIDLDLKTFPNVRSHPW